MKLISLFTLLFLAPNLSYSKMTLTQQLEKRALASSQKLDAKTKKTMLKAIENLRKTKILENAINKNSQVPEFEIDGQSFSSFYKKNPIVLKFYRGSWCPYCQLELKAYESFKAKIEAKGYKVIILTPDTKKEILKFKKKQNISYEIYSDKDNAIAKKFGVAFKLEEELSKLYKRFGINLKAAQGNEFDELPLPGTYVINQEGKITYAFIDVDYKKRLDPQELLTHL